MSSASARNTGIASVGSSERHGSVLRSTAGADSTSSAATISATGRRQPCSSAPSSPSIGCVGDDQQLGRLLDHDLAGVVVGRRQQRTADVAETAGHAVGELQQRGRRLTDSTALIDEERLEVMHVGLQEVTTRLERLDLAQDRLVFGFGSAPRLDAGLRDQLRRHLPGRVEGRRRFVLGLRDDSGRLRLRVCDRAVGSPLGEQQCSTDGLGFLGRCLELRGGGLVLGDLLESGHRRARTRLHGRRLVLGALEFVGNIVQEDADFVLVGSLANRLELGAADSLRIHLHEGLLVSRRSRRSGGRVAERAA